MRYRKYDNMLTGAGAGLILPLLTLGILVFIFQEMTRMGLISEKKLTEGFRIRTLSLLSIAVNLILVKYFQNRRAFRAIRGITIPTFIYIVLWIIYFSGEIL